MNIDSIPAGKLILMTVLAIEFALCIFIMAHNHSSLSVLLTLLRMASALSALSLVTLTVMTRPRSKEFDQIVKTCFWIFIAITVICFICV